MHGLDIGSFKPSLRPFARAQFSLLPLRDGLPLDDPGLPRLRPRPHCGCRCEVVHFWDHRNRGHCKVCT